MISWVTMERIVEQQMACDAHYRKQAAGRPLRSAAKRLSDEELLAKLRSLGIKIDRPWLERRCGEVLSAEEMTQHLLKQASFHHPHEKWRSDWIWICLAALWQCWCPEKPSFEALDDKMQTGYQQLQARGGAVSACRTWLEAWSDVLRILDQTGMQSIQEFDHRFGGTQSLFNWIQDLESELWNAGLEDRQFLTARIALCEEGLRRFRSDDDLMTENRRRALAESYYELGETEKAESLFRSWLDADPYWGWGWIGWSDCYRFTRTRKDLKRCEQILREGFSLEAVRDRTDIAERLADVCEEQGRGQQAAALRRQAEPGVTTVKTSRTVSSVGKGLRQKTRIKFEGAALPLSELSNVAAMRRGASPPAPAIRQKIGRNELCPCGSGKKFKKCCST